MKSTFILTCFLKAYNERLKIAVLLLKIVWRLNVVILIFKIIKACLFKVEVFKFIGVTLLSKII